MKKSNVPPANSDVLCYIYDTLLYPCSDVSEREKEKEVRQFLSDENLTVKKALEYCEELKTVSNCIHINA